MSLVAYAEQELKLAGLMDKGSDYDGMIGETALEIVKKFASQGHSGGSAHVLLAVLEKLLRFQPLTPLTSDPQYWMEVADGLWQSKRDPHAFSKDGGKTWYVNP